MNIPSQHWHWVKFVVQHIVIVIHTGFENYAIISLLDNETTQNNIHIHSSEMWISSQWVFNGFFELFFFLVQIFQMSYIFNGKKKQNLEFKFFLNFLCSIQVKNMYMWQQIFH